MARRNRQRRRARRESALRALTSGAMALPGVAGSAAADSPEGRYSSSYQYSFYSEDPLPAGKVESGSRQRYDVHAHQFRLAAPIGDRFDAGLDVAHETMSGATPWYLVPDDDGDPVVVMTGATVDDARTDALLRGSYYLDSGRVGLAGGISAENDYFAWNGGLEGERSFNEKNTTLSTGAGFSLDTIEPSEGGTDGRPVHEEKQSYSVFAGIAQVIGRASLVQSTLSYEHARGFLSDPYKKVLLTIDEGGVPTPTPVPDSRPDTRHRLAWLTRFRHHFSAIDGTLHADYRFYADDWNVTSHMLEAAWHQSLWHTIRLVPSLRYYSQSQADFYAPYFDFEPADGYASADYRLSPYGALSWRLRAETVFATWSVDWLASITYERYTSSADLALGKVQVENPGLVTFNRISIGLTARF
jgi:hypothetical protein